MAQVSDPAVSALTLDELRARLAPAIAAIAGFDGWSEEAVATAHAEAEVVLSAAERDVAADAYRARSHEQAA